jgi:hypothetical protein
MSGWRLPFKAEEEEGTYWVGRLRRQVPHEQLPLGAGRGLLLLGLYLGRLYLALPLVLRPVRPVALLPVASFSCRQMSGGGGRGGRWRRAPASPPAARSRGRSGGGPAPAPSSTQSLHQDGQQEFCENVTDLALWPLLPGNE